MKQRINTLLHILNQNLYERTEVIQLALLTTLAGESIFLLGPPGVAKSLIARRIKHIFEGGKSFEYLMNRFSTPDEIFGPIAISKLKNEDKYERLTEAYLPTADVVFLDEIWKAGPSIQNALLTVINEKIYRNGTEEVKIPLKGLVAASNELPAKGEGLEALWDRFIIRYLVLNISNEANFSTLLKSIQHQIQNFTIEENLKITDGEFKQWQQAIDAVILSDEALNVIHVIRHYINQYNERGTTQYPIYVSDRRWLKIVRLLKTSAFLNERKAIDLMDCFIIAHCIWDEVEQIEVVKDFVSDAIKKHGYSLKYNLKAFEDELSDLVLDMQNQVKEEKTITYYVPKTQIINEVKYYELIDKDRRLIDNYRRHYLYIKKLDFESLNKTPYKKVNLRTSEGDKKEYQIGGKTKTSIIVRLQDIWGNYSEHWTEYKLVTSKREKQETKTKIPHKAILKEWDKKVAQISNEAMTVITEIKQFQDTDLKALKENLFVNPQLAALPEYNLNMTIEQLMTYKLKVEEIKSLYDKLT